MAFDPISSLFSLGESLVQRLWPDPVEQAKQLFLLEEMKQNGDLAKLQAEVDIMLGQLKINEAQANHKSVFVAGARPFIIWVGGVSLAWTGIVHPLLMWVWAFADISGTPPPMVDAAQLTAIVGGLLGIGGMRSYDKKSGSATNSLGK
jgi:hypothetical protein